MKLAFAILFLSLAGCASLTPTTVNPGVTQVTNTAMSLVAASSGDCSVPITAPNVATACANLPVTATVTDAQTAFNTCVAAAASARLTDQAAKVQAALCATAKPSTPVAAPAK